MSLHRAATVLAAALAAGLPATSLAAQEAGDVTRERVTSAPTAVLRGLDKVAGDVLDVELAIGQTVAIGRLQVTLGDCRYPTDNPAGDAYAYLVIRDDGTAEPRFSGWMIASAPALNALEHPRYDIWVMRCKS